MARTSYMLTEAWIRRYAVHLMEQERAVNTIQKYVYSLHKLQRYLNGTPVTKMALIGWKEQLMQTYAPASINTMLASLNSFLSFMGWHGLEMKPLKVQRTLFFDERRELSRSEYMRLVNVAQRIGKLQLALILQTICATGIRVSELRFITREAVQTGRAEVFNKGKRRTVFLPGKLCRILRKYLCEKKITDGAIFITRTGRPLDRSNIWREMKDLCEKAGVDPDKVFPHNLRHLFARTYYAIEKDLSRLADILGHTSVNTTRIYTVESGMVHARQLERMNLIIT